MGFCQELVSCALDGAGCAADGQGIEPFVRRGAFTSVQQRLFRLVGVLCCGFAAGGGWLVGYWLLAVAPNPVQLLKAFQQTVPPFLAGSLKTQVAAGRP